MFVKLGENLINLDVIVEVSKLTKKVSSGFYYSYRELEYNVDARYESMGGFGFEVKRLNDKSDFIKLSDDLEESKRLYDKFIKYLTKNQSEIPEIK